MKQEISLSPKAVRLINEILCRGNDAEVTVVGRRIRIEEVNRKLQYDVVIPKE